MNAFSAEWLQLREPFDHAAREASLARFDLPRMAARWREAAHNPWLSVVDLACGSGSNLRALAPQLGGAQRWRLIDHDPALLAAAAQALAQWAHRRGLQYRYRADAETDIGIVGPDFSVSIRLERLDLARDLHRLSLAGVHLLTASALLDLVSATWLRTLIGQAGAARAAMLFALSVDGRIEWSPALAHDSAVHRLFAADLQRDKGFGLALGEHAAAQAATWLHEAGYAVVRAPSDWVIEASTAAADRRGDAPALLGALIDGMAQAAAAQAHPGDPAIDIPAWQRERQATLRSTCLRVGHVDLLATPA